ncbi:MAG: PAS domain S-box protein, partial [Syntrophales bacterium LBB04]|nr:PAS domain S-box protein [Syntrophales bacterium LBB04]
DLLNLFLAMTGLAETAIERLASERELRSHRDHLEELVRERTAEIAKKNSILTEEIAERKRAEEALRRSEDQIRLLLNSTAEAIYGVDLNGDCTFCNASCLNLLGYKEPDELVGKNMHRQIHLKRLDGTPFPEEECRMTQTLGHAQGAHADDEVFWRADETCFPVEYWSYPQHRDGAIVGAVVTFLDITEPKRAKEALRGAQVFTSALLENILDGVVACDADGTLVLFNRTAREWHGLDSLAIPQEKWADYYDLYCADGVTPMTVATVPLARAFRGEELRHEGMVIRAKGRPERHILANAAPFFDEKGAKLGAVAVMHDITERKRAEESLKETTAFLNTLLNAIPAPIFYKDTNGRYIGFNKSYEEFYGKTQQELVGKTVFDIAPRDLAEVYHAKDNELFDNPGTQVYDFQVKDTHGVVHDVVFHKSTFCDSQGQVLGLIGVILDITERKRLEEQKSNLIIELQNALSEVKKLSGFLPICASCKKIRDDRGYWNEVERYIGDHSEAQFSHGICPDCMRKLYPEIADEVLARLEKAEEK